ncbi:MAG: tRNA uridine-5-carboxymethylaminomethyl(34) synthesis GTPase MnmE [Bacteroidales bacterium]|nr:tRNA uridine-5-carboxymethylaminomethyl(34) synthesis GTPase MnmE [Bacteroidales bacterium]
MKSPDTIAAVATPPGVGGVAVVRISGPDAIAVTMPLLRRKDALAPRHAYHVTILDGSQTLDDGIVVYYPSPNSYTGEDTVEMSCHGSRYVTQRLLELLVTHGARLAKPGEFTMRAFLGGKMDLAQAEAVADIIDATSESAHTLATRQLSGQVSRQFDDLRSQFVELASLLELELDFSDEDVEFADRTKLLATLDAIEDVSRRTAESFRLGNAIKNGIPVAIVGQPNAGKSTLLNALLGDDRAIVSDIAGTTRDTIEELVTIDGFLFRFVDTAGLRHSDDPLESAGIERSLRAVQRADVVILVDDGDTIEEPRFAEAVADKRVIHVRNKVDLVLGYSAPSDVIPVSAKLGTGLDELRHSLVEPYLVMRNSMADAPILANARHYEAFLHILDDVERTREGLSRHIPTDLVMVDVRDALYHLGQITGQVSNNELLDTIFSRFCIGK